MVRLNMNRLEIDDSTEIHEARTILLDKVNAIIDWINDEGKDKTGPGLEIGHYYVETHPDPVRTRVVIMAWDGNILLGASGHNYNKSMLGYIVGKVPTFEELVK